MSDGYNVLGYDVFLCHGGANDGVKQMLDDVKGRLQGLPTRGGGASIRAFLDERDLMWDGQPHSQIEEAPQKAPIGVVVLDEHFLRSQRTMSELGVLMAALADGGQSQPAAGSQRSASSTILPVVLMEWETLTTIYKDHWKRPIADAARREGFPPATLADLQRLLTYQPIRQDQHNLEDPTELADAIVDRVLTELKRLGRVAPTYQLSRTRRPVAWMVNRTTRPLVGRDADVQLVLGSLQQHGAAVIWGGPGEGKTTIAMEAAAQLRILRPTLSAFELNMQGVNAPQYRDSGNPGELASAGLRICQQHAAAILAPWFLQCQGGAASEGGGDWTNMVPWLRSVVAGSVLLCIENAEEILHSDLAEGFQQFVEELQRLEIIILVTSRCTLAFSLQGARHHVSSLPPEAAAKLLRQEAGPERVTQVQAEDLAMICGFNVLAVNIISGFIARSRITAQAAIQDAKNAGLRGVGAGTAAQAASGAAAELDAQRTSGFWLDRYLIDTEKHAAACLSLFAATFNASGAATVLYGSEASAQQQANARQMLRALCSVSVLQQVPQPAMPTQTRYSMHPLMRGLAMELRSRQPDSVRDSMAINFVVYVLDQGSVELANLDHTAAGMPVAAQLLEWEPNIAAMLQLVAAPDQQRAGAMLKEDSRQGIVCRNAMDKLVVALARWGQLPLAADVGHAVWEARRRQRDDPDTLISMSNLSTLLGRQGYNEQALVMARQVLAERQRVLSDDDPSTLNSMANLSDRLAELGQHKDAARMAADALSAQQRVLGSDHPSTLDSMFKLSICQAVLGQHKAAADTAQRELAQRQRVLGAEHPHTLASMANVSNRLAELGQDKDAAGMAQQVLTARQCILGPEHPDTLRSKSVLSSLLTELGRDELAADMAKEALAAQQRVLGPDHPDTLQTLAIVGSQQRGSVTHQPLLPDTPALKDHLGVNTLVEGLCQFLLRESAGNLTVGIYGAWGSGKSSLMQQLMWRMVCHRAAEQSIKHQDIDEQTHDMAQSTLPQTDKAKQKRFREERQRFVESTTSEAGGHEEARRLCSKIALPRVMVVWFNAWECTTAQDTWASLICEVTRQLEEDLPWTQRVSISWRFSLQRRQHQLLYNAFLPIVIVLVLVIILSIVGWKLLSLISAGSANSNIRDLRAVIPALGALTVIVLGYQQIYAVVKPVSEQIAEFISLPDHHGELAYQHSVFDDLKLLYELIENGDTQWVAAACRWLCEAAKSCGVACFALCLSCFASADEQTRRRCRQLVEQQKDDEERVQLVGQQTDLSQQSTMRRRVIVFIDDLDRCSEDSIMQVLEAINLVLAKCQMTTVLGVATDMLYRAIRSYYSSKAGKNSADATAASSNDTDLKQGYLVPLDIKRARQYLGKIVQVEVHMPSVQVDNVKQLLLRHNIIIQVVRQPASTKNYSLGSGASSADANLRGEPRRQDARTNATADRMTPGREASEEESETVAAVSSRPDADRQADLSGAREISGRSEGHERLPRRVTAQHIISPHVADETYDTEEVAMWRRCHTHMAGQSPRDIKRLLNNHRLMRVFMDVEGVLDDRMRGRVVLWAFLCWRFGDDMNGLLTNGETMLANAKDDDAALGQLIDGYADKLSVADPQPPDDTGSSTADGQSDVASLRLSPAASEQQGDASASTSADHDGQTDSTQEQQPSAANQGAARVIEPDAAEGQFVGSQTRDGRRLPPADTAAIKPSVDLYEECRANLAIMRSILQLWKQETNVGMDVTAKEVLLLTRFWFWRERMVPKGTAADWV